MILPSLRNESFLWNLGVSLVSLVIQVTGTLVASKLIDREVYGEYIFIYSVFAAFSLIFLAPTTNGIARYYYKWKDLSRVNTTAYWIVLLASVSVLVIFMVATNYSMGFILAAVLMNVGLWSFSHIKFLSYQQSDYRLFALVSILTPITRIIVPLIVGISFLLSGQAMFEISSVVLSIMGLAMCFFARRIVFVVQSVNMGDVLVFVKFIFPFVITSIFSYVFSFSSRYFIDIYMSREVQGTYALLVQFSGMILFLGTVISGYLSKEIMPKLSDRIGFFNEISMKLKFVTAMQIAGLIALVVLFLLISDYLDLNAGMDGDEVIVFFFLVAGNCFMNLANYLAIVFNESEAPYTLIFYWLITGSLVVVLNFSLVYMGVKGLAISQCISSGVYFLLLFYSLLKRLRC